MVSLTNASGPGKFNAEILQYPVVILYRLLFFNSILLQDRTLHGLRVVLPCKAL